MATKTTEASSEREAQEIPLFWQDEHDHPLPLVYTGNKCEEFITVLAEMFGPERTFQLSTVDITKVMEELMPFHFSNSHLEYFAYKHLECGVFIAFNHVYHDAYSAGMMMRNHTLFDERACYVPPKVNKIPADPLYRPNFIPVNMSTLKITKATMIKLKSFYGMTQNEAAFLIASTVLSKKLSLYTGEAQDETSHDKADVVHKPLEVMCLHSMRRYFGKEGQKVGGDYSCSSEPFVFHSEDVAASCNDDGCKKFPNMVKHHMETLKQGKLNIETIDGAIELQKKKCWIFDTWINAGLGQPGDSPSSSFQLKLYPELMAMYAVVCRNFIIVVDIGDEIIFTFLSDDLNGPLLESDVANCWIPDDE